jgi:DNA invertase Pin-like site-specific DNA recombinase/uncharacterized coiled-coil protein SlyX
MKHAAAYLRRSSVSGDSPGDASKEAQMAANAALAALYAPDVAMREYVDWGISGRRDDRPQYVAMKAAIVAGEVCCVFAYSLSRLGRSNGELDAFFRLCAAHDVTVFTKAEGALGKTSAMGGFLLTVMSAMAELESELAKERSGVARVARQARHDAAGVAMPGSLAIYGRRHVTENGITRIEADPDRPIDPILAAYRDAGSIRGACELLQVRGIPAPQVCKPGCAELHHRRRFRQGRCAADCTVQHPHPGKVWGSSTLTRILKAHIPDELPTTTPRGDRRGVWKAKAVFAGLLRCHCGRTMTPNVVRGQYYCAAGRDSGSALHGRYNWTEAAIRPGLEADAARYDRKLVITFRDGNTDEREAIERRMANLDVRLDAGRITGIDYKNRMTELQAEVAKLAQQERTMDKLSMEPVPDWSDVEAMNRHLRRLWTYVQLDADGKATPVWAIPAWQYTGADVAAAMEAER